MSLARVRVGCGNTSKCIRDIIHHPKTPINQYRRSFSTRNNPFAFQRKSRGRISSAIILGQYAFATSSILQEPSSTSSESRPHIPWPKSSNPTPYEIFNLPRNASQKEIKSRYFLLVKQYHPDHAPPTSVDRFRKVVESYKILSNPPKRQEYDLQHPLDISEQRCHSEFRQPWSGSRLSRRKTEQKGPPPSGRWTYTHPSRARPYINPDYSQFTPSDSDNAHFNYESHYKRNLEQEMKIKKRMDELHAHRLEFERQREENKQSMRMGFAFTGGLFVVLVLVARAMVPS